MPLKKIDFWEVKKIFNHLKKYFKNSILNECNKNEPKMNGIFFVVQNS